MKINAVIDDVFSVSDSAFDAMQLATQELIDISIKEAMYDLEVGIFTDKICLFGDALEGGAVDVCSVIELFKERLNDNPESRSDLIKIARQLVDLLSPNQEGINNEK